MTALGAIVLVGAALASCATPTGTSVTVSPESTSVDLVCDRLQGINVYWAGAWQRDYDARVTAGVEDATARQRASISLEAPFRRAVAEEAARDGADAQDPAVQAAVRKVASGPDEPSGYAELAAACGVAPPFPAAG
jgi:hypothetical protein